MNYSGHDHTTQVLSTKSSTSNIANGDSLFGYISSAWQKITWANIVAALENIFEPSLGTPSTNGYVLSSTTAGTRSWVAQSGGIGEAPSDGSSYVRYNASWFAFANTTTINVPNGAVTTKSPAAFPTDDQAYTFGSYSSPAGQYPRKNTTAGVVYGTLPSGGTSGSQPFKNLSSALTSTASSTTIANGDNLFGYISSAWQKITWANIVAAVKTALGWTGTSGNSGTFAQSSGTLTAGNQATFDGSGNLIASTYAVGASGGSSGSAAWANISTAVLNNPMNVPTSTIADNSSTGFPTGATVKAYAQPLLTGSSSQLAAGNGTPITLGTNLSMSGTTLNATGGGTTTNAVTFNTSGGASAGATFNGSAATTISYNTVGAQANLGLTTLSGNTTEAGTVSGAFTTNDCLKIDSHGNIVDAGGACTTGGGGTVSSGTTGQFAYYASNGTVVGGRNLVAGDIPALPYSPLAGSSSITTVGTLTGGSIPYSLLTGVASSGANSNITSLAGLTTPLSITQGGTGVSSTSQNYVLIGPTSSSGAPTWRALVAGDIPALPYSPLAGSSSITTVGTLTAGSIPYSLLSGAQAALTSGTNIKTVGGVSLLGSGDLGIIGGTYGGTGVNNGVKTITLGGNLTTSGGAYNLTLVVPATGSYTLPTAGTLIGSADTSTVTNTMLAGSITPSKLSVGSGVATAMGNITGTVGGLPVNIASGSVTLTTSTVTNSGVIASATCQSLGTHQTATGVTYADVIDWTITGSGSGYTDPTTLASGLLASAMLTFIPYSDAAGYIQIKVCNLGSTGITLPTSAGPVILWKVRR